MCIEPIPDHLVLGKNTSDIYTKRMYLAVDIGGTKTLLACFDKSGKVTEQVKFPTPHDYGAFLADLQHSIDKLAVKDFQKAAVAVPAKLDRDRGIAIAFGNLDWEYIPIEADIERIVNCPVLIENDAKLAGLSEALLVKDEFNKVLYVTISTGIGGALIIDGIIDPRFADMEVGQILLEHQGKLRDWEDFASGRAIQKKYSKRVSDIPDEDEQAWYGIARNIAIGLIDLMATLTPEVVILGGGVGAHLDKFKDRLVEELKIYENPMFTIPPIRQAVRSEEAVIYGCYELIKQHHVTPAK
jgi:predicted NBD/HSP70 family sugar kinase